MLLIGLIKKSKKGSTLLEVLIAMIIILICFGFFIVFSLKVGAGSKIKQGLKNDYLLRKTYLELVADSSCQTIAVKCDGYAIKSSIEATGTDSIGILSVIVVRNHDGIIEAARNYMIKLR